MITDMIALIGLFAIAIALVLYSLEQKKRSEQHKKVLNEVKEMVMAQLEQQGIKVPKEENKQEKVEVGENEHKGNE